MRELTGATTVANSLYSRFSKCVVLRSVERRTAVIDWYGSVQRTFWRSSVMKAIVYTKSDTTPTGRQSVRGVASHYASGAPYATACLIWDKQRYHGYGCFSSGAG
jgi:hypothetical protein